MTAAVAAIIVMHIIGLVAGWHAHRIHNRPLEREMRAMLLEHATEIARLNKAREELEELFKAKAGMN